MLVSKCFASSLLEPLSKAEIIGSMEFRSKEGSDPGTKDIQSERRNLIRSIALCWQILSQKNPLEIHFFQWKKKSTAFVGPIVLGEIGSKSNIFAAWTRKFY
jgi:hypothetical protein